MMPRSTSPAHRHRVARRSHRTAWRPMLLALVIASCNSDSATGGASSGGPLGLPTGSFDIGIPTSVAVRRGSSTELQVTIVRTSYVAPVFVRLAGLPAGVVAPVINSTSTTQLRIPLVADTAATLGPKTVEVTATGDDAPTVVKSFVLTVSAP